MEIELREIAVRDLAEQYSDNNQGGVRGYGGKLDIRPPYQREFIYNDSQKKAVIDTLIKGFPLNVMYWADRQDGTYEIIDGQQRTISICQYVNGDFSFNNIYFHNLPDDKQKQILDYTVMVYFCTGTTSEKLDWFKTINIAGAKLEDQELRNAVYHGTWVADAKRYFSRERYGAHKIAKEYLEGKVKRQKFLETAICWISENQIDDYMARHQHDPNAEELWEHFEKVIEWVKSVFTVYRKEMQGLDWGLLYNAHKDDLLDPDMIESRTAELIADDDIQKHSGIYYYLLTGDERHLKLRAFDKTIKRRVYELQSGQCALCSNLFDIGQMEADHITPWKEGGHTVRENCQMLCRDCNRRKGAR